MNRALAGEHDLAGTTGTSIQLLNYSYENNINYNSENAKSPKEASKKRYKVNSLAGQTPSIDEINAFTNSLSHKTNV